MEAEVGNCQPWLAPLAGAMLISRWTRTVMLEWFVPLSRWCRVGDFGLDLQYAGKGDIYRDTVDSPIYLASTDAHIGSH